MKWDLIKHGLAAVPVGFGHVRQQVVGVPAGVVDEGVDAAEAIEGGLDHVFAAGHGADVGVDVGRAAAGGSDFGFDLLAAVVVEVGEDDGHAVFGEGDGGVAADALGGAGDDGDAVFELVEGGHGTSRLVVADREV